MTAGTARVIAVGFLLLFLLAVTWPGMLPFNRVRPLVLGLPFSLAWVTLWVALACLVLWWIHATGRKGDDDR
jgi:cbb3-type cytochrome oxidase subunit 3